MSKVLVVSPHPDDESIGCGGTIANHVDRGDDVAILFLTSGEAGGHGRDPRETARIREREAVRAASILGVEALDFWRERDGRLRVQERLVRRLAEEIGRTAPDFVYVTHARELHADHRAAAHLAAVAVERCRLAGLAERPNLLAFEVWTPIQKFDQVVDITQQVGRKMRAIRAHRTQCAVVRFDAAAMGLARYRGELHSWPGGSYAEVFQHL